MFRALLKPLLTSACLLLPVLASASTIAFEHDGGGLSYLDSSGFFYEDVGPLVSEFPPEVDELTLTTGLVLSTTVHPDGGVDYTYDGGILTFYASSNPVAVIPILPFGITLSPPIYDSIWGNYPGPVSTMNGGIGLDLVLGAGTLDSTLAQALGVHETTLGGSLFFVVDDIAGDVNSLFREATPNFINGRIEVQPVPEPSALIMVLLGSAGVLRRLNSRP